MTAFLLAQDGRWLALVVLLIIAPQLWRQIRDHNS